jgi:hypothetical protein
MKKYKALLVLVVLVLGLLAVFCPLVFCLLALTLLVVRLTQRTKVGEATRTLSQVDDRPESRAESWFIEGTVKVEEQEDVKVSCSFVEFDGRGDFLEFKQYRDAYTKVRQMAEEQPVLLVIYCHGWKNNVHSGDAALFNDFLIRLAGSDQMRKRGARVHGLYLGWRGNVFKPHVGHAREAIANTTKVYGGPITNARHQRRQSWPWNWVEQLTYWSRKHAAEAQVSGVPMARTIFACANVAKRVGCAAENSVVVIGHSFGALTLERCLGQASVGMLSTELNWFGEQHEAEAAEETEAGEATKPDLKVAAVEGGTAMPFDLILFVNSASPSIHAKVLNDFLRMYRTALSAMKAKRKDAPVIVSVTSTEDGATGKIHPVGNWLAPLSRSMNRWYRGLTKQKGDVRQGYFYARTPGHNPLLVNHWVEEVNETPAASLEKDAVLNSNLDMGVTAASALSFMTSEREKHPQRRWRIVSTPPEDQEQWRQEEEYEPKGGQTAYWMLRCRPEIIKDHGDIWNANAMEMYAAIYRLVQKRRME